MSQIYKTQEGERLVRERYQTFLKYWLVPNKQFTVPTREGETFIVASGDPDAPAVILFHGGMTNSAIWMGDVVMWAKQFRVYAVDLIGEPGLSAPSRPERVERLVLLSPAGIGRQKLGIVFKMVFLQMCGAWGKRRLRESILGKADGPPAVRKFMEFIALIHEHFLPRMVKLPVQPDESLRRLRMPVLAILGGKDPLLDSSATKRRLEQNVPQAVVHYLPDAGHTLPKQAATVMDFLQS